jgi:hypothetical protein
MSVAFWPKAGIIGARKNTNTDHNINRSISYLRVGDPSGCRDLRKILLFACSTVQQIFLTAAAFSLATMMRAFWFARR